MKPVYNPCHTGASQTLILENIYHLSERTSAAVIVLLQGVAISIPLRVFKHKPFFLTLNLPMLYQEKVIIKL